MSNRVVKLESGSEWGVIQDSSGTFFAPVFTSEIAARIFAEHYRRSDPFSGGVKERTEWEAPGQMSVADSIAEFVSFYFGKSSRATRDIVEAMADADIWADWRDWLCEQQAQRKAQAAQEFAATGQ